MRILPAFPQPEERALSGLFLLSRDDVRAAVSIVRDLGMSFAGAYRRREY